jgi:hypothetical protein
MRFIFSGEVGSGSGSGSGSGESASGSQIEAAGRLNNNGKFPFLGLRIGLRLVVSRLGCIVSAGAPTPLCHSLAHSLTHSTLLVHERRNSLDHALPSEVQMQAQSKGYGRCP